MPQHTVIRRLRMSWIVVPALLLLAGCTTAGAPPSASAPAVPATPAPTAAPAATTAPTPNPVVTPAPTPPPTAAVTPASTAAATASPAASSSGGTYTDGYGGGYGGYGAGATPAASVSPAAGAAGASGGTGVLATQQIPGIGVVLVGPDGHALYTYGPDPAGSSTCTGGCAQAWPPLIATSVPRAPAGAMGAFSLISRADGSKQVAYNGHPLYEYAGDSAPGTASGQGQGNVWYAAEP
jgi:predicted lipoprotein with Yx(FWY)xxD motif